MKMIAPPGFVSLQLPDGKNLSITGPVDVPDSDVREFLALGFKEYVPPPETKVDPMDVVQKVFDKMTELVAALENRPAPIVNLTISQPKSEKIITAERMPDGRMVGRITTQAKALTINATKNPDGSIEAEINE